MQSAYRPNHSTETALVRVLNDALTAVDRKQRVALVLFILDLSAAFDTANHLVLLDRLRDTIGVEGLALKWFRSYLTGRVQRVRVKGVPSKAHTLGTGVPQGSVLGPLLFSIYMGPLGDLIRSHGPSVHFYADDTQLYIWIEPNDTANAISNLEGCIQKVREKMALNILNSMMISQNSFYCRLASIEMK
jgi:retron-type reverse transcriptase